MANMEVTDVPIPEIPDGLWDQRKQLLERRLKGKKGRTGQFKSPLGTLHEDPIIKVYNEEYNNYIYQKKIWIKPLKEGNRNLPRDDIIALENSDTVESCLNKCWDSITKAWGNYWNPPAPGTGP